MIRLSVSDGKLHCSHPLRDHGWCISVNDIVLIAEYTTDEGPQQDDYFLVFVTRENGEFYYSNVTMYAAGIDESLTALESTLGCSLNLSLPSCTTLNSRVVWPREIVGSAYFHYEEVAPQGLWQQLRSRVLGKQMESHIAEPIREYLANLIPPQSAQ